MIAVAGGSLSQQAHVREIVARFPSVLNAEAIRQRMRVQLLGRDARYLTASPVLKRLGVDVDAWPVPPAGLFVVEERTLYLRTLTAMTVAHEWGHAIDAALGNGVYLSGFDSAVRSAFARARAFVTPYAACGIDEYFAECLRAFVGVNDDCSPWPQVSRERLAACDPPMLARLLELSQATRIGLCISAHSLRVL